MDNKNNFKTKQKVLSKKLAIDIEKVRETAYYLWEKKGKPTGSDLSDWLEAEKKLNK